VPTASDVLAICERPDPAALPERAADWLAELGGPTVIRIAGRDRSRRRVVVTLLHGNEPSCCVAVHRWLREAATPAVDLSIIIAAVATAIRPPGFAYRTLPGARDLNRCFRPPFAGREGELAAAILKEIETAQPEALVDVHNNTGHNPPYGIGSRVDSMRLALTAYFARHYVHSNLRLGALMEAVEDAVPSCSIECGRAGDPAADQVALRGLRRFFGVDHIRAHPENHVSVLERPIRVSLRRGASLGVGDRPSGENDLTIAPDLDRHNFHPVPEGTTLGWLREGTWPLEATGPAGLDCSRDLFEVVGTALRSRRSWIPIMMTTDADIAASDCLFYIVHPRQ
jgi:Succinylglutamate desuccinylase / Aspartoacylase family